MTLGWNLAAAQRCHRYAVAGLLYFGGVPFVQPAQLAQSLERLRPFSPLLIVSVPAMLQADVPLAEDQAAADALFGGGDGLTGRIEQAFLDEHFRPGGAPPGKRWLVPSSSSIEDSWVVKKYAGSSLQAQRSERTPETYLKSGSGSKTQYFPRGADWTDFVNRLQGGRSPVTQEVGGVAQLLPLFDLAVWLYWDVDVADVQELIQHAASTLHLPSEFVDTVYSQEIPPEASLVALGVTKMSQEDWAEVLSVEPPADPAPSSVADLVEEIEDGLAKAKLEIPNGVAHSIVAAWLNRDIAVLVGAPGTGKTTVASAVAATLNRYVQDRRSVYVPVGADWTAAEFIGYENLAGRFVAQPFADAVLRSGAPTQPHVLILDEFNLSQVEQYLAAVLDATERAEPIVPLPGGDSGFLPFDTLMIATCNSPRDDPASRNPVSLPSLQRMSIIQMPNVLFDRWSKDGSAGVHSALAAVLDVESSRIEQRFTDGEESWLDGLRRESLGSGATLDDLGDGVLDRLTDLIEAILATEDGQRWMTMRPLRDILVRLLQVDKGVQLDQLVTVVRQKILSLAGRPETLGAIVGSLAGLPGFEELKASQESMVSEFGEINRII